MGFNMFRASLGLGSHFGIGFWGSVPPLANHPTVVMQGSARNQVGVWRWGFGVRGLWGEVFGVGDALGFNTFGAGLGLVLQFGVGFWGSVLPLTVHPTVVMQGSAHNRVGLGFGVEVLGLEGLGWEFWGEAFGVRGVLGFGMFRASLGLGEGFCATLLSRRAWPTTRWAGGWGFFGIWEL